MAVMDDASLSEGQAKISRITELLSNEFVISAGETRATSQHWRGNRHCHLAARRNRNRGPSAGRR